MLNTILDSMILFPKKGKLEIGFVLFDGALFKTRINISIDTERYARKSYIWINITDSFAELPHISQIEHTGRKRNLILPTYV